MDKEQIEVIKWKLTELYCSEPENIESNDLEIIGEDENGRDGYCTVQITELAGEAINAIDDNETLRTEKMALSQALQELVNLKEIKDTIGASDQYRESKDLAWKAARQVLSTLEI